MPVEFYEEYSWPRLTGWTPSIVELNGGIGRFDSESPLGYVRFTFDQMGRYLQSFQQGSQDPSSSELREMARIALEKAERILREAPPELRERAQRARDEAERLFRAIGGTVDDCFDATTGQAIPCGTPGATRRATGGEGSQAPATAAKADCGTFDVGCHLGNFFTSPTAKDVGKRVGLVLLAVVLLAVAVISLR